MRFFIGTLLIFFALKLSAQKKEYSIKNQNNAPNYGKMHVGDTYVYKEKRTNQRKNITYKIAYMPIDTTRQKIPGNIIKYLLVCPKQGEWIEPFAFYCQKQNAGEYGGTYGFGLKCLTRSISANTIYDVPIILRKRNYNLYGQVADVSCTKKSPYYFTITGGIEFVCFGDYKNEDRWYIYYPDSNKVYYYPDLIK